jgi:hypothetical protein
MAKRVGQTYVLGCVWLLQEFEVKPQSEAKFSSNGGLGRFMAIGWSVIQTIAISQPRTSEKMSQSAAADQNSPAKKHRLPCNAVFA